MMIKVNPKWTDAEIETFRELIKSNDGYCPCSIVHDENHKCICQEFFDKSENSEEKKYQRTKREIENMPLEEVARLYVKYTVKYMAKRKDSKEKYYCCTKKEGFSDYYEDCFILADLSQVGYSRFSKTKLSSWIYYNPEYNDIGYKDDSKQKWINLENKIRSLVEKEFIRVGCKVEHIDETDKLDEWFIKQSGYENTMIVTI